MRLKTNKGNAFYFKCWAKMKLADAYKLLKKNKTMYIFNVAIIKYLLTTFVDILQSGLSVRMMMSISLGEIVIDFCSWYITFALLNYLGKVFIHWTSAN